MLAVEDKDGHGGGDDRLPLRGGRVAGDELPKTLPAGRPARSGEEAARYCERQAARQAPADHRAAEIRSFEHIQDAQTGCVVRWQRWRCTKGQWRAIERRQIGSQIRQARRERIRWGKVSQKRL